jgi:WD40 repeat protein
VCPACGGDNELPKNTEAENGEMQKEESSVSAAKPLSSPLSNNASPPFTLVSAHKKKTLILTWTVLVQCCIFAGTLLFAAKTGLIPKEFPIAVKPELVHSEITVPPMPTIVSPALPEVLPPETESLAAQGQTPLTELTEPKPLANVPETSSTDNTAAKPVPSIDTQPTLADAEALLASFAEKTQSSPDEALREALAAAKIYETLGQEFPETLYWMLGRTYTSVSWGNVFAEGIPAVETMTLSNDHRWLLTQLRDKTVRLWDLTSYQETEAEGVTTAGSSKSGRTANAKAFILDASGKQYSRFVFTPDRHWIIGAQTDGTIRIWDMSLKNPAETSAEFREKIPKIADMQVSPDGRYIAVRCNAAAGIKIGAGANRLRQVAFRAKSPDNKGQVAFANHKGLEPSGHEKESETVDSDSVSQVYLWNLRNLDTCLIPSAVALPYRSAKVRVIRFSPDSKKLAVGGDDAAIRIYDLSEDGISSEPRLFRGHQLAVTQIEFAPNGQWFATGGQDNAVYLWNIKNTQLSPEAVMLQGHTGWISVLAVDAEGEFLYSGSFDGTVKRWKINNGKIESAPETALTLNTECGIPERIVITGNKIAVCGTGGGLFLAETSQKETETSAAADSLIFRNSALPIKDCALTHGGGVLLFCYENTLSPDNSGIRLWHLNTAGILKSMR